MTNIENDTPVDDGASVDVPGLGNVALRCEATPSGNRTLTIDTPAGATVTTRDGPAAASAMASWRRLNASSMRPAEA